MRVHLKGQYPQIILLRCSLVLLASCVLSTNAAPSTGQVTHTTDLKTQPTMQADNVTSLTAEQQVDVTTRQGGWYQVETVDSAKLKGWLPLFFVRFTRQTVHADASVDAPGSDKIYKTQQQVTTTTGVRGLNRGDIEASSGDFMALAAVQKLAIKTDAVQEFASAAELTANPDIPLEQQP